MTTYNFTITSTISLQQDAENKDEAERQLLKQLDNRDFDEQLYKNSELDYQLD